MSWLRVLVPGAACALLACGGKVAFDGTATSGAGGAAFSCAKVDFDFNVAPTECAGADTCELTGKLPDGRSVRESCVGSTKTCRLFIDEVEACSCPQERIDFASVCNNGVPTCFGWSLNYSIVQYCKTP